MRKKKIDYCVNDYMLYWYYKKYDMIRNIKYLFDV